MNNSFTSESYCNFGSCDPSYVLDHKIAVPIPMKPKVCLESWQATFNALDFVISNDIKRSSFTENQPYAGNSNEDSSLVRLSKEERQCKIWKYFEKKKKRKNSSYVRYQYRKVLADKRARFQGRFVKVDEIRQLILKGEKLTAKDKSDLELIIYSSHNSELIKAYEDSQNRPKQLFTMTKDDSVQKAISEKMAEDMAALSTDYMSLYMEDGAQASLMEK